MRCNSVSLFRSIRSCVAAAAIATVLAAAHDQPDHDPGREHWEIASPSPDRIILTWEDDPATTQSVTWRTSSAVTAAFAEIAPADSSARFDRHATRIEATTTPLLTGQSYRNRPATDHYHSVTFRALQPDELYAYRVGDGEAIWSEWIQFRTAKKAGPITFLYFGDAQNDVLAHWSRLIRAAYSKAPEADFSIYAGDLVDGGHHDREWAEWHKAGGWIHSAVPSLPVPGNHEYERLSSGIIKKERRLSLQWRPQFTLPVVRELPEELAETVYALKFGDLLVIALNSNRAIEEQAEWLERVLAADTSRWRVVTFHHPIFSSGKERDNRDKRSLWKPVLDRHSVDLALQGHDHTYARGHAPLRLTERESEGVSTMYVNSVSGPKMYDFMADGWTMYAPDGAVLDRLAENAQFFQVVRIDGDRLRYEAYSADSVLYDAFEIDKGADGVKRLVEVKGQLPATRRFGNSIPYKQK